MNSIHLRVMELEGYRQVISEKFFSVFSPDHKRIVENPAVHPDSAVHFGINDCGCADHHTVI